MKMNWKSVAILKKAVSGRIVEISTIMDGGQEQRASGGVGRRGCEGSATRCARQERAAVATE